MFETVLLPQNIKLNCASVSYPEAIEEAGRFLVSLGYVNKTYISSMRERETMISTFLEYGVAMPHGLAHDDNTVHKSGVVVFQYPNGIDYNGETCHLVIGVCSKKEDHIPIISHIARVLNDEALTTRLWTTTNVDDIYHAFVKEEGL